MAQRIAIIPYQEPYGTLLGRCDDMGWHTKLTWDKGGWALEIREDNELLCRVRSKHRPPDCFSHLGARATVALRKAGYLGP